MEARGLRPEARGRVTRAALLVARACGFAALAALITNLGTSCAFTGEDVFAGIRDPDGVAPYGDLGQPLVHGPAARVRGSEWA